MEKSRTLVSILVVLFFAKLVLAKEASYLKPQVINKEENISAQKPFYIAKSGDNLISILKALRIRPIFGAKGHWQNTVKMNEFMGEKNGRLIFPGNKIYLPKNLVLQIEKVARISASGEILLPTDRRMPALNESEPVVPKPDVVAETTKKEPSLPIQVEAEAEKTFAEFSNFSVSSTAKYFRVEGFDSSTNSRAILLSNMGTGVDVGWTQRWSKDFETHINFGGVRLAVNESATKTIEQRTQELLHFEVGSRKYINEKTSIDFVLGSQEELIYRALTTSTVRIEKLQSPVVTLGLNHDFIALKKLSLAGGAQLQYFSAVKSEQYDAASSIGWATFLGLKHLSKKSQVFGNLNYSTFERSYSPLNLRHTDFGVTFGLGWNWDAD